MAKAEATGEELVSKIERGTLPLRVMQGRCMLRMPAISTAARVRPTLQIRSGLGVMARAILLSPVFCIWLLDSI